MKIDIKHLSELAHLNTSENDAEKFEKQMQDIVAMIEHLPNISSNNSLLDSDNPMVCRKDEALNIYRRDDILKNAPQVQAGCVVVPKIIEE